MKFFYNSLTINNLQSVQGRLDAMFFENIIGL